MSSEWYRKKKNITSITKSTSTARQFSSLKTPLVINGRSLLVYEVFIDSLNFTYFALIFKNPTHITSAQMPYFPAFSLETRIYIDMRGKCNLQKVALCHKPEKNILHQILGLNRAHCQYINDWLD